MAIINQLADDLDGSVSEDVKTRHFSIEGRVFEVDLSEENYKKLHVALDPYIAVGRVAGRKPVYRVAKTDKRPYPDRKENAALRQWARENGWPGISERGRVPAAARTAYARCHQVDSVQ